LRHRRGEIRRLVGADPGGRFTVQQQPQQQRRTPVRRCGHVLAVEKGTHGGGLETRLDQRRAVVSGPGREGDERTLRHLAPGRLLGQAGDCRAPGDLRQHLPEGRDHGVVAGCLAGVTERCARPVQIERGRRPPQAERQ
jgi:hypothetical protein